MAEEPFEIARIIRSRRKTVALVITPEASLVVRAPLRTPVHVIESLVEGKSAWIRRKLAEARRKPSVHPKEFTEGEDFWYLGKPCPLRIVPGGSGQIKFDDGIRIPERSLPRARETLTAWYRSETARIIGERCADLSGITGIRPARIRITGANRRWGSCSSRGNLSFSWRLSMTPLEIIDYLIVHELVHIRQPNHSKRFWDMVERILPDYRDRESWLKEHERYLKL